METPEKCVNSANLTIKSLDLHQWRLSGVLILKLNREKDDILNSVTHYCGVSIVEFEQGPTGWPYCIFQYMYLKSVKYTFFSPFKVSHWTSVKSITTVFFRHSDFR